MDFCWPLWFDNVSNVSQKYIFSSNVFFVYFLFLKEDCFLQNLWGQSATWPCWTHFSIAMATCSLQYCCFLQCSVMYCGWPASLLLWVSLYVFVPAIMSNHNALIIFLDTIADFMFCVFSRRNDEHYSRTVIWSFHHYLCSCLYHLHVFGRPLLCCIHWYHPALLHLC